MTLTRSRFISVPTANNMIPLLTSITKSIVEAWEEIIQQRHRLEGLEKGFTAEMEVVDPEREIADVKAQLNHLIDKINDYIREVEDLGCFVEEFKRGIINFPCLYSGRKVFLCWALGEDAVTHWHELDETFNDRTPIHDIGQFLTREMD